MDIVLTLHLIEIELPRHQYTVAKRERWVVLDDAGNVVEQYKYRHHADIRAAMLNDTSTSILVAPDFAWRLNATQTAWPYEITERSMAGERVTDSGWVLEQR